MEVKKRSIFLYGVVLVLCLVLSIGQVSATGYINYFGIAISNVEYNNLINLGFSEDEIYYMNEETYNENKDIVSTLVSKTSKYYKSVYTNLDGETYSTEITKEEYENQGTIEPRGTVTTEYKNMVSTMSQQSGTFRYKVTLAWRQMPSVRSYDVIGIGFEDDVYISSSVYFNYHYCISNGTCYTKTDYYNKKKLSTGGTAVYKFPSDARSMTAVLYYDVAKDTTGTISALDMCGDYAHAITSVSSSSYSNNSINLDGIYLGTASGYFDEIPCAVSTWYGSW